MIRILATIAAATLFAATASAADALTMPSPADGFPTGWNKTAEDTCTPRKGHTITSSVYMKMGDDGYVRNIVQTKNNGKLVVQFRRLLKDGEMIGADATVIHSGRIQNFMSGVPGSFESMRSAVFSALGVTEEEYAACARAAESKQRE